MLLKDEPYQPFITPVQNAIPKQRMVSAEDAIAMLRRKGYILVDAKGTIIEDYHFASPV